MTSVRVEGVLHVDGLGYRDVLEDITFSVSAGELLVILGENGSGKTTLFRCLLGMQRHRGTVTTSPTHEARSTPAPHGFFAGILDGEALYRRWSVRRNLEYHLGRRWDDRWVRRLVEAELWTRPTSTLSLGQRRLVMLAITFATEAPVLLLDEFANALDHRARKRVVACISDTRADGRSVIATGHDLSVYAGMRLDAAILEDGRLGAVEHVAEDERIEDVRARHDGRTQA
jgi:ABC-type multidrug transport system ATPase subunit